jgi:hypothetical protein
VNRDSNTARWIRAATEQLHDLAREYEDAGMDEQADEVNEAAEVVGRLHRLPDPTTDEED